MADPRSPNGRHGAMTPPPPEAPQHPDLSVVIPLCDEEQNIDAVARELIEVLDQLPLSSEVVLVDDGSQDHTAALARRWCQRDPRFRLIEFRRNFGQTAALSAGFDHSRGQVIVAM